MNRNGCSVWIITSLLTLVAIFSVIGIPNSIQEQMPHGFSPSERINPALVLNIEFSDEDMPFQVQGNRIFYGRSNTYDCQYVLGGEIFGLSGNPITEDIMITLDLIELEGDNRPEFSHSFPGQDTERGISGWSTVVVSWDVDYLVWLTQISTGERVSPKIYVETQDCDNNLAVINFVQVKPLD